MPKLRLFQEAMEEMDDPLFNEMQYKRGYNKIKRVLYPPSVFPKSHNFLPSPPKMYTSKRTKDHGVYK